MNKKKTIIKIIIITILCVAGGVTMYFKAMYDKLDTVKIDVSNITAEEAAAMIQSLN